MTVQRILSAAGLALLMGCSGTSIQEQAASAIERTVQEVAISSGEPVTIADLSIEGMSCEMMCGGSIKKALARLGVGGTEIRMSEDDSPNHAIVTYNDGQLSDAQMIEAIQALHDGQYKVVAVSITKQVKQGSSGKAESAKPEKEDAVQVYSPREVVLPSVLAILSRILRL